MEQRKGHFAGMSPATVISLCVALSSVIGTWFVMQDNISDNEKSINKLERSHTQIWQRINGHNH